MTFPAQPLVLRDPTLIYRFDAVLCFIMGIALLALASPLASLVGWAPMHMVLLGAGLFLFPWALSNWTIGAATAPDRLSLAANLIGDGVWVLLSVLLLVLYSAQMTAIGVTFIIAQALAVSAVFAIKLVGFKTLQA
jgi:hypothetical protein